MSREIFPRAAPVMWLVEGKGCLTEGLLHRRNVKMYSQSIETPLLKNLVLKDSRQIQKELDRGIELKEDFHFFPKMRNIKTYFILVEMI